MLNIIGLIVIVNITLVTCCKNKNETVVPEFSKIGLKKQGQIQNCL